VTLRQSELTQVLSGICTEQHQDGSVIHSYHQVSVMRNERAKHLIQSIFVTALISLSHPVLAESRWSLGLETGAVWQAYNDVQIPGDTGTRFSLSDLAGDGPDAFVRLELMYDIATKHQLRFLVAPLQYTRTGELTEVVRFTDKDFAAGVSTEATYKFNSYRATYRYQFYSSPAWTWYVGGTLKVRDAEISLSQPGVSASNSNLGVVPLLNLYGDYAFADRWHLIIDFDGLASPQGRALDLGLKVNYDLGNQWMLGGGIRVLEGGADNDEVYNFAQFNYALVSVDYRF
jgi:hypothetical protein